MAIIVKALFLIALSLLFTGALAHAQLAQTNQIRVQIAGLRNDKGQVVCALQSSATWLAKGSGHAVAQTKIGISHKQAACVFSGIAPGKYAVSVFHDENLNGRLDKNLLGIPREGVGVSNNAMGHFGPPRFEEVAFPFSGGTFDLEVHIRYL